MSFRPNGQFPKAGFVKSLVKSVRISTIRLVLLPIQDHVFLMFPGII